MPESGTLAHFDFLKAFFTDRHTVGAVTPTSRAVARRMAHLGNVQAARNIAEFGPGTGAITFSLLETLPADSHMWAFEIHRPFVEHLQRAVRDPRFTLLEQSATTIEEVRQRAVPDGFDAVISSIPFSLIGLDTTRQIIRAVARSLKPGGTFVALQYHPTFLRPFLMEEFTQVRRSLHLWNIPPTLLLTGRVVRQHT
ncbi:MAG: methyltransferase domain-containing protein [Dehalococcoidia bacterium]|nr:methyltransferase domain-containing protein [Dehalococcoidia bacterium]